jgi:ketopantoate hydroxymethyltransferase
MDDMIRHTSAVRAVVRQHMVIGDCPTEISTFLETAIAMRDVHAEAGCDAINLEGGSAVCDRVPRDAMPASQSLGI